MQIEPEIVFNLDIHYSEKKVTALTPRFFTAYNDCSIRHPNARKIGKKNWGANTKGISDHLIPLTFQKGCEIGQVSHCLFSSTQW